VSQYSDLCAAVVYGSGHVYAGNKKSELMLMKRATASV